MQLTLDSERAGTVEVHVTYLDAAGPELAMPGPPTVTARSASGAVVRMTVTRFTMGHFGAAAALAAGRWTFDAKATAPDGSPVEARFERNLKQEPDADLGPGAHSST